VLSAILITVVVTLLLSGCIIARSWAKGEYGVAIMAFLILILMISILPVLGKIMM
jgi:hypothetical protein